MPRRTNREHVGQHPGLHHQQQPQRERKRLHKLSHRFLGKHVIDQVSGGLDHAPSVAAGTEPTAFAAKRCGEPLHRCIFEAFSDLLTPSESDQITLRPFGSCASLPIHFG